MNAAQTLNLAAKDVVAANELKQDQPDMAALDCQYRELRAQLSDRTAQRRTTCQASDRQTGGASHVALADRAVVAIPICVQRDAERLDDQIEDLREKLYELSWRLVDCTAQTLPGLKLKAQVIADISGDQHDDLTAALARSLSSDILVMFAQ